MASSSHGYTWCLVSSRALAAVLLLALFSLLGVLWSSAPEGARRQADAERGERDAELPASAPPSVEAGAARELVPAAPSDGGAAPAPSGAAARTEPPSSDRPRGVLAVEVREKDGRGVSGAALRLSTWAGPHAAGIAYADERAFLASATTDTSGAALFAEVPAGPYRIVATAEDGRQKTRNVSHGARPEGEPAVRLELPERAALFVVKVVDALGAPMPEARVELARATRDAALAHTRVAGADGEARFEDLEPLAALVLATTSDGRCGLASAETPSAVEASQRRGGLEVVVAAPGRLQGTLLGLAPEVLARARVVAHALSSRAPHGRTHGRSLEVPVIDGRYLFESLAAGEWTLALADPGGARLVLPRMMCGGERLPNSVDPLEVEVAAGTTTVCDLEVANGRTLASRACGIRWRSAGA